MTPSAPEPGYHIRWIASVVGWAVARFTLIVEGNHDDRYLRLADQLYFQSCAKRLITPGMVILPAGDGPDGGTKRILRDFHVVHRAAQADVDANGRQACRIVAILDDDADGRGAFRSLCRDDINCIGWRDVFLLQRWLPRTSRNSQEIDKIVKRNNEQWKNLNCEIEDLLALSLLKKFDEVKPAASRKDRVIVGNGHHSEFTRDGKTWLLNYSEANARLEDVVGIVELLKVMRYHFGLGPDGE
jgi:hypothetical protein